MRVSGGYAYGEDGNLMPGEWERMQQDQARKERPVTEPLTDPREMRKAILLAATRGDRFDGKPAGQGLTIASSLARTAHDMARFSGLSGEDQMTILAYLALRELEHAHDLLLRDLSTRVSAPLIVRRDEPAPSPANARWLCLLCGSGRPGHHGTLDDRVTPCPNTGKPA